MQGFRVYRVKGFTGSGLQGSGFVAGLSVCRRFKFQGFSWV